MTNWIKIPKTGEDVYNWVCSRANKYGVSQREFCRVIGFSTSYLHKIRNAKSNKRDLDLWMKALEKDSEFVKIQKQKSSHRRQ